MLLVAAWGLSLTIHLAAQKPKCSHVASSGSAARSKPNNPLIFAAAGSHSRVAHCAIDQTLDSLLIAADERDSIDNAIAVQPSCNCCVAIESCGLDKIFIAKTPCAEAADKGAITAGQTRAYSPPASYLPSHDLRKVPGGQTISSVAVRRVLKAPTGSGRLKTSAAGRRCRGNKNSINQGTTVGADRLQGQRCAACAETLHAIAPGCTALGAWPATSG